MFTIKTIFSKDTSEFILQILIKHHSKYAHSNGLEFAKHLEIESHYGVTV